MAHPFRYFRKHQKAFLAVAGVIAIFVFVIGDSMFSMIRQSGGANPNSAIATWKGGTLSYHELEMLAQRRYFVSNFLKQMQGLGARRIIDEGGTPVAPGVPNFILQNETPDQVRYGVVMTRILADQGRKAGIAVSDGLINYYLKEIGFRRVSNSEILSILQSIRQGDPRALEEQLFAGLHELLLGNAYVSTLSASIGVQLPEEKWQEWREVNERIAVEAATLPVEGFVAEVPEPSDAELLAFYEQYKDKVGNVYHLLMGTRLPAPDPGFKQPRRVKLNYLVGDVNAWTEKMRGSVTEEEIADYYERNKRTQFLKSGSTPEFDESLFDKPAAESDEKKAEEQPAESSATESNEETSDTPASEQPAAEQPQEEQPAAEEPAPEQPAEEKPADNQSGSRHVKSPFRLVATESESADETAEASDQSAKEEAAEAADKSDKADDKEASGSEEEKKEEYDSLDSVRDTIKEKLARDKAVQEIKQVMDRVYAELQTEYKPYGFAVVTARSEETEIPAPPETLTNLKERATKEGLASEETVLLTQRELVETFVGKAVDLQTQQEPVAKAAFDALQLYEPYQAIDLDGNRYLVTKVEDQPEVVPALKDIRAEVVSAWKRQEAAKLALKKAEEIAADCKKTGDTLAAYCVGKPYEVVTTDLFSATTFGTTPMEMQAGPRLGDAPPLAAIGPDFMQKAFALGEKDVDAVLSYDHTNAYVFRLDRRERTQEELRKLFLEEANTWYGGQIVEMFNFQAQQQAVFNQIAKRVGLDLDKFEEALHPKQEKK